MFLHSLAREQGTLLIGYCRAIFIAGLQNRVLRREQTCSRDVNRVPLEGTTFRLNRCSSSPTPKGASTWLMQKPATAQNYM